MMDPVAAHHKVIVEKNFVVKIRKNQKQTEKQIVENHRKVRKRFPHLPKFFGVIKYKGENGAVVARADPIPITKPKEFVSCFVFIVTEAAKRGIIIDPKPSNFGKTKEGEYVYLDETGVGDKILIPDITDSFIRIFRRSN